MTANKSVAQRLGRVLERVTSQSSRLSTTPEFGSWVLGRVSESQRRRRIRIQSILTTFVLGANLIGVGVAVLVVTLTFPVPNVFDSAVLWITFVVAPDVYRAGLRGRSHLGNPSRHQQRALGDRGARAVRQRTSETPSSLRGD